MRGLFTLGLLVCYASLIPVAHRALGGGLILSPQAWVVDAWIGIVGAVMMFIAGSVALIQVLRNR